MRWRWQVLRRTHIWLEPALYLVATVGSLLVLLLAFKIGQGLRSIGPGFQWMILAVILLVIQSVILGTSMARVVATLYLDSDLELLLAAPLQARSVFAARLVEVLALPGLFILCLLLAGLWGLGLGLGMGPAYHLFAVPVVLFLPLIPEALGTLLTMALVRYLPAWRLREILAVAGGLLWLIFYLTQQALFANFQEHLLPILLSLFSGGSRPEFLALDPGLLPGNWAAWSLVAAGLGRVGPALPALGPYALISLGAFGLCLLAAERLYLSGWANAGVVQRRRQRVETAAAIPRSVRWLSPGFRAVMLKDWRMLRRDLQALLQLAWPLAFTLVWLMQGRLDIIPPVSIPGDPMIWWTGLSVAWLCVMVVTYLAITAISREGRSFWVLRSAPLSTWELIAAKFWSSYLIFLGLGLAFSLGTAWLQGTGLVGFSRSLGLAMLMGIGLTAISLALGARSPNLTWDNPRQAYSQEAGCMGFIAGGVYALIMVVTLAVPIGLEGRGATWGLLVSFCRLAAVVGLTAGVVWKALHLAVRGVEEIEL